MRTPPLSRTALQQAGSRALSNSLQEPFFYRSPLWMFLIDWTSTSFNGNFHSLLNYRYSWKYVELTEDFYKQATSLCLRRNYLVLPVLRNIMLQNSDLMQPVCLKCLITNELHKCLKSELHNFNIKFPLYQYLSYCSLPFRSFINNSLAVERMKYRIEWSD